MKIQVDILEAYLDGELAADQQTLVEQALRHDPATAQRLASLKSQRALRAAALQTYAPAAAKTGDLAASMMNAFRAAEARPLARIGSMRWAAAIAAALALSIGGFYLGRTTAPAGLAGSGGTPADAKTWIVQIQTPDGAVSTHEFTSLDAAQKFADDARQKTTVVADSGGGVF